MIGIPKQKLKTKKQNGRRKNMKKRFLSIIIAGFCLVGFTGCTEKNDSSSSYRPADNEVTETFDDTSRVYDELMRVNEKFAARDSYKTVTEGKTVASLGYEQEIKSVLTYSDGVWFSDYSSISALVKLYHKAYLSGKSTVYKHSDEKSKTAPVADYRTEFGVAPGDGVLGGYELKKEYVSSALYTKYGSGATEIRVVIDGERAATQMKIQMKKFGCLKELPVFFELSFVVYCENGEDISAYSTQAKYDIKKEIVLLGVCKMTCDMNISTDVSDFDGELFFPSEI